LGMSAYRVINMPRTEPMSRPKIIFSMSVLGLLIAAASLIPFPWFRDAPFVIEPVDVEHVYTMEPGTLVEIAARPGTWVEPGEAIARLENSDLTDRVLDLETEVKAQQILPGIY